MTQEIIVLIIITVAIAYVGYKIYRKMNSKKTDNGCDSGCDGCGSDCSLKELKGRQSHHNHNKTDLTKFNYAGN